MDLEGSVLVSGENLKRWRLICDLIEGRKTQFEVAEKLNLSDRQVRRLKLKVEQNGIENLVHGLRGRRSNNYMSDAKKDLVLNLWSVNRLRTPHKFMNFSLSL